MLIVLLAIAIGVLGGIIIPGSWYALTLITQKFEIIEAWRETLPLLVALSWPTFFALVVLALIFFTNTLRSADGFTYFISDLHFNEGRRKLKFSLVHGMGSLLLLLGGGVVGIEAFGIEFLSALGGEVGRKAKLSSSQIRTLASCGIVACISALWGSPAFGILFVIELLHGWGSVVSIVGPLSITAFVATAVGQAMVAQNGMLQFQVETDGGLSLAIRGELFSTGGPNLLLAVVLVAAAASLLAGIKIWLLQKSDRELHAIFATRRSTDFSIVATGVRLLLWAAVTGLVGFYFSEVLGGGVEFVKASVTQSHSWKLIAIGIALRFILEAFTYTTIGSLGVIFPTFIGGAALGALLGVPLGTLLGISTSTCAVLTMGAFFSACFGAPIAATALVYSSAAGVQSENAFFLLAVLSANYLSHFLCGLMHSDRIPTLGLYRHGIRFKNGMCFNTLSSMQVKDALQSWVPSISDSSSMAEAYKRLMDSLYLKLPVVNAENVLVGTISLADFYGLEAWRRLETGAQVQQLLGIKEILKPYKTNIYLDMSLEDAYREMRDEEIMPVIEKEKGTYAGLLIKSDVVNYYNKEIIKKAFRR